MQRIVNEIARKAEQSMGFGRGQRRCCELLRCQLRCQVWWITACLKMGFTQWDSYNILKDLVGCGAPHSQTHLVDPCWLYRPVWWSHGRPVGCSSHGTSLLQETPVVLWFYLQWSRWAFCGVLVGTRCVNVWKPETADFCHRLNFWHILGYWGCVDLVAWIIYYYIYTHIYYLLIYYHYF